MKNTNLNIKVIKLEKKKEIKLPKSVGRASVNLGCDPEFFIVSRKTHRVITADKVLPPKSNKLKISDGSVFFDGVQAEVNLNTGYTCREFLCRDLRYVLNDAINHINSKTKKYDILIEASVPVTKRQLKDADDECKRFGCDPDINAYTRDLNKSEIDAETHLIRYAGGHIHLGMVGNGVCKTDKMLKDPEIAIKIIKVCDRVVGIPAVLLDTPESSKIRRKLYGKAGDFRIQPHGIEYRTLSNFWLRAPELVSLFTGLARTAFSIVQAKQESYFLKIISDEEVKKAINESDTELAWELFERMLPGLLKTESPISNFTDLAYFIYLKEQGLEKIFQNNLDKWKFGHKFSGSSRGWNNGMRSLLGRRKSFKDFWEKFSVNLKYKDFNY